MIRTEVTSTDLADLAVAIRFEEHGAVMRRDLMRGLRSAVKPAVSAAKSSIMSMPAGGLRQTSDGKWRLGSGKQSGDSLRRAIARQVTTETALTPRSARIKVKVRKRNMPRNFTNAPKAVSLPQGWRHPVIGTDRWVSQIGKPGWFDVPLLSHRSQIRAAIKAVLDATANRIARKV